MTNHKAIPEELKRRNRWAVFTVTTDQEGKKKKQPKNAKTGGNAQSNNADTWTDFATASDAQQRKGYEEIGIATGDNIVGIDLDHVIVNGELIPQAREIVDSLNSYTEISLSGDGLHILCKGELPDIEGQKKYKFHLPNGAELEMFYNQFLIVTGNVFEGRTQFNDRTADIYRLWTKHYTEQAAKNQEEKRKATEPTAIADLDDRTLIEKAMNADNGDKFRRLWDGDTSDYNNDHSAADFALCQLLAFWTGCDSYRMDSLFRQSGLYRDKWNRKAKGTQTYGQLTVSKACDECTDSYNPNARRQTDTTDTRNTTDTNTQQAAKIQTQSTSAPFAMLPITHYIYKGLKQDIESYQETTNRRTGFKNFDAKMGQLHSDLYMFGGQPGAGKTTFALQLADQLAEQGEPVIYFTFEQTRLEIITKSFARYSLQTGNVLDDNKDLRPQTAEEFKAGRINTAGRQAIEKYKDTHSDLFYIVDVTDTTFSVSVDKVVDTVDWYCNTFGVKPCVFIDYLQVMQATNYKADARGQTDEIINKLKNLQQRHKLFMFVISSFNRENYINPVSLESFKESGRLEYTAAYMFGMQYSIMGHRDDIFKDEKDKSRNFRRGLLESEQNRPDGRKFVQIVALKTRYRQPHWSIDFVVDHAHDTFRECDEWEYDNAHGEISTPTNQTQRTRDRL